MRQILRRRERMGLTQVQLAKHPRLKVAPETLCRWETGACFPRRRHLEALAGVFNCKVADLFDDNDRIMTA